MKKIVFPFLMLLGIVLLFSKPSFAVPSDPVVELIPLPNPTCTSDPKFGTANLSWGAYATASYYQIELYVNDPDCCEERLELGPFTPYTIIIPVPSNSYSISMGTYNCFSWRVRAIFPGGYTVWTDRQCVCDITPCSTFDGGGDPGDIWHGEGDIIIDYFQNNSSNGTKCITLTDKSGQSLFVNSVSYKSLNRRFPHHYCLCWDVRLVNTPMPVTWYPVVYFQKGSHIIKFTSNTPLTAPSNWVTVCAPIGQASPGGSLPYNVDGVWSIESAGTTPADFSDVMNNTESIYFSTDIPSGWIYEVFQYDNVCIRVCDNIKYDGERPSPLTSPTPMIEDMEIGGSDEILIFPNPTSSEATIHFYDSKGVSLTLKVVDMTGKVVMNIPFGDNKSGVQKIHLKANDLPAGVYNVIVQSDSVAKTQRLTIIK